MTAPPKGRAGVRGFAVAAYFLGDFGELRCFPPLLPLHASHAHSACLPPVSVNFARFWWGLLRGRVFFVTQDPDAPCAMFTGTPRAPTQSDPELYQKYWPSESEDSQVDDDGLPIPWRRRWTGRAFAGGFEEGRGVDRAMASSRSWCARCRARLLESGLQEDFLPLAT